MERAKSANRLIIISYEDVRGTFGSFVKTRSLSLMLARESSLHDEPTGKTH
ncbi:MAG: hypothetical protein L0226_10400 [Acidobacteria bacterium]|nr:hypothetical protein [Acidobacteriota bacterium]